MKNTLTNNRNHTLKQTRPTAAYYGVLNGGTQIIL